MHDNADIQLSQTSSHKFRRSLLCIFSRFWTCKTSCHVFLYRSKIVLFCILRHRISSRFILRMWNRLTSDNSVWRSLFARRRADGWDIDLRRMRRSSMSAAARFASAHGSSNKRRTILAPLELDWYNVYKTRAELDRRWNANALVNVVPEDKENGKTWEPVVKRLEGHRDRYVSLDLMHHGVR